MTTKKQLKEIAKVEKKVSKVCDAKKGGVIFDEVTGIPYVESKIKPKKTVEITLNDKGVIINKETGKPHFGAIDIDEMKKMVKERNNIEFELILTYDDFAPSLKIQLKELGFKIPKGVLKDAEKIRFHLLALNKIKILSNKQANKCFKKLNIKITNTIMDNAFDEEEIKTMHIKTKNIN